MKRLHLFIIKSYLGPLVLTFFISLFLLLMQFLWKYIDELIGKGLEWNVIAELLMYASATLVPMALPLAILLSSIMTFGNLGENYELVALKSAGISLLRIMFPLIIVSIFISVFAFYFSNNMMPYTNLKMRSLLYDVRNQRPELSLREGIFTNEIDGYSIRIGHKSKDKKMLYDLMIYDHTSGQGNKSVTFADSGEMKITGDNFIIFTLFNGNSYNEMTENKPLDKRTFPHRTDKFDKQTFVIELQGFGLNRTDENLFKNNYQMLNLKQLTTAEDSLIKDANDRQRFFEQSLYSTNLFKRENKQPNAQGMLISKPDTANYEYLNTDSLFNNFDRTTQLKIVDLAQNYARSVVASITNGKEDLVQRSKWLNRHKIEWHRKFTLSFACLVLFFVGAPLGAIIRKGGLGMPVVISILLFILYYIIDISGQKFVKESFMPAYLGMWLSSAVLLPIGIFLTYKAANDSVILNIDTYIEFFKKFKRKSKK